MNRLKYKIVLLLLVCSLVGFAQKDTGKVVAEKESIVPRKQSSDKDKLYISGGIGASTILYRIYYVFDPADFPAYGVSQSEVLNGTIDYRTDIISFGACISYQTATGVPYTGVSYNQTEFIESLTRLNLSARVLVYVYSTDKVEIYCGFRLGCSFWTDEISGPSNYKGAQPQLTLTKNTYPSIQFPWGARFFMGNIGLHIEIGLGTPYFAEAGVTLRF